MPDVKEDMDEVFKKAGENYPLNTQSSDWNEVHKSLQGKPIKLSTDGKNRKYLPLLLLLIILTLAIFIYKYGISPEADSPEKVMSGNDKVTAGTKVAAEQQLPNKGVALKTPGKDPVALKARAGKAVLTVTSPVKDKTAGSRYVPSRFSTPAGYRKRVPNVGEPADVKYATTPIMPVDNTLGDVLIGIAVHPYSQHYHKADIVSNPPALLELQTRRDTVYDKQHKNLTKQKSGQQKFYAGIITGPDFSTVKFQKVIKTGISGGIIAGYRVSNRLSLESGLYLNKKYYYSEGRHFSTKKVYIPSYTKIENLDGYCLMLELPVNVKYAFKPGKKGSWYGLIGSTSYIMKKEDYSYRYKSYGQIMEKKLLYRNASKNWAAMLNLAFGYSRNISKNATMRVEPYIQLPFKGIGIGELPVTSAGLHVALSKSLF